MTYCPDIPIFPRPDLTIRGTIEELEFRHPWVKDLDPQGAPLGGWYEKVNVYSRETTLFVHRLRATETLVVHIWYTGGGNTFAGDDIRELLTEIASMPVRNA